MKWQGDTLPIVGAEGSAPAWLHDLIEWHPRVLNTTKLSQTTNHTFTPQWQLPLSHWRIGHLYGNDNLVTLTTCKAWKAATTLHCSVLNSPMPKSTSSKPLHIDCASRQPFTTKHYSPVSHKMLTLAWSYHEHLYATSIYIYMYGGL